MINMIYALLAIMAVMAACIAFGYTLRGVMDRIMQPEPKEEPEPDCKTCRHESKKPSDEPCKTCLTKDVSMWEAKI